MKMAKKILAVVLASMFVLAVFAGCSANKEENTASEKLVLATSADFPPYESIGENGEYVGIDIEVAQAIADKLGKELVVENMDFDSIISSVASGKADMGMAGMTVTEDRKTNVDFSDTYAIARQVVIVKADGGIASLDDLEGLTIGVQQGTTGDIYASEEFGDDHIERYAKGMEAVQALTQGKVDAVIIDNEPARVFVNENEGLVILDEAYADEEYAIAVKKGNTELLNQINAALAELKADGTLDAIVAKYISAE